MPFIQRIVEPRYLSRTSLQNENGDPLVSDCELEAVTNNTLSNALRQLASLVLVANDIFTELTDELNKIQDRSSSLKAKIGLVEERVAKYDPKKVPVPEGDISTFALLREHYQQRQAMSEGLFSSETRPRALRALYEAAAKTPVHAMRQMDRWRRDGHRSSRFFLCTPVLGAKRRKIRNRIDIDIETRMPAVVGELRRWTSAEAIGDMTVTTDCINRITSNTTQIEETDITDYGATSGDDEAIDHKLPSPEEQLQVLALKFPAEIVAVDISGRRFDRMTVQRRSLLHSETMYEEDDGSGGGSTVRRRTRTRKPRGKRRNTLAGTDQKEIRDALTAGDQAKSDEILSTPDTSEIVVRSRSTDLLRSKKSPPNDNKKSHFNTLKQWGKSRLKLMHRSSDSKSIQETSKIDDIDDINIYETVTMRRRKNIDKDTKGTERKTSYSSSEKSSSISLPIATPLSAAMNIAVKLRESSAQRRQRRNKDEQHSSSGNWSASSESGRASIGSEITTTTHPKSTTSAATSSNSLNQHPPSSINSRRRFLNTSTSSSVTSEGTLTPDIIHDIQDDGETSSVYSCDTEGYYTSFHMDSGLKTLKEEELGLPMTPLHTTSAFSNSSNNTAENEYELFGKGSTSTTTSSAGTVCTTLRAADSNRSLMVGPTVPERISSLTRFDDSGDNSLEREFGSDKTGTVKRSPASNKATVVAVVHKQSGGDVSPDSGHNTSSSPIESVSSPNGAPSCSEFEFSESSDLEGVDRIERIRIKTTINSSRIPSMCVITPPHSDDESIQSMQEYTYSYKTKKPMKNNFNIPDLGSKNASRPKLNLPLQPTETDLDTLTYTDLSPKHTTFYSPKDSSPKDTNNRVAINGSQKHIINVNPISGYATIQTDTDNKMPKSVRSASPSGGCVIVKESPKDKSPSQPILKATLMPLNNMFGKLKTNLSNFGSKKEKTKLTTAIQEVFDSGDYVTIADVRNNNEKAPLTPEVLYANDIVKTVQRETEYISLNELHQNEQNSLERNRRHGARVTLDSEGKVVYSSDSLRRRKAHTTFEPGPFVKDMSSPTASPLPTHRTPRTIRPVNQITAHKPAIVIDLADPCPDPRPLSPQLNKVVIRANPKTSSGLTSPTADFVRMPPTTIVTPTMMSPKLANTRGGAYVHMQEDRGGSLSPALEEERAHSAVNMHPQSDRYYNYQMEYQQNYQIDDGYMLQRHSPLYKTLPSRMVYNQAPPDITLTSQYKQPPNTANDQQYNRFSSLPRRKLHTNKPEITQYNVITPIYQQHNVQQQIQHHRQQSDAYLVPQIPQKPVPYLDEISRPDFQYSTPNKPELTPPGSKIPMGISNFFSPITKQVQQQVKGNDSLKISPIDPRNTGSFKSSTPARVTGINLTNKLLSPKKSTMSNEELYAVIHKSKKKLNIQIDDLGTPGSSIASLSPASSLKSLSGRSTPVKQPETGYFGEARNRNSWSPNVEDGKPFSSEPGSRQSWACSDRIGPKATSRLDFKKLLLQQNSKTPVVSKANNKLSAVEQLKISKSQPKPPPLNILDLSSSPRSLVNRKLAPIAPGSPKTSADKKPPSKLLSPRSNWRFANPRSDVLSSTILEDCREDESSHSSIERSKSSQENSIGRGNTSKKSLVFENSVQNSIARGNVVADGPRPNNLQTFSPTNDGSRQNVSRQSMEKQRASFFNTAPPDSSIQKQRTSYFNTAPISSRYNSNNSTNFPHREGMPKSPSPPTLETAL